MAEIKSTLELVMERTRHLRQSEEEKQEQATAEFRKGISGLVQKFLDGTLAPERFRRDLRLLQETLSITDGTAILDEIFKRMDLDGDVSWALILIGEGFGINPQGITTVVGEYRKTVGGAALQRIDEIRKELGEKRGIYGSAIVPHLAADPEWAVTQRLLHERFEPILGREFDQLKQAL
jgi:hypothetical protein